MQEGTVLHVSELRNSEFVRDNLTTAELTAAQANKMPKLSPIRECRPKRICLLPSTTLCNGHA